MHQDDGIVVSSALRNRYLTAIAIRNNLKHIVNVMNEPLKDGLIRLILYLENALQDPNFPRNI